MSHEFDYIIAGAGASGLSLAYHLNQAGLTNKRILLVDKAPKTANDRTWCFWEAGTNVFEPLLFKTWQQVRVMDDNLALPLDMGDYSYKMLRGIDFYQFMDRWLATQPNITRVLGEVSEFAETPNGASVRVGDETYTAAWVFNSVVRAPHMESNQHHLLQHFKGWVIETEQAQFDPAVATMMDFRVPQHNDTRFVYVMPFDARKALVEFTVFGSQVLPDDDYRAELRSYLSRILKLDEYQIHEEESGVIPMTEAQFPARMSEHVINIGTAGGSTKPSTGYTFLRIQQQAGHIASALQRTGQPEAQAHASRFKLYDSIFLNVLDKNRRSGKRVFTDLYQRNPAWRIFKFLDEQTTLTEDLRIMSSTHLPTFTRAAFDIFTRPLK